MYVYLHIIQLFMSYNQPSKTKQFVKAKPLKQLKDKPPYQRDTKKNTKKYQQKPNQSTKDPRQHIKFVQNQFKITEKTPKIIELCAKFPRYFCQRPQKPEIQSQINFAQYTWFGNKKQPTKQAAKQMSSDSSDPNWESDEQKQIKLVSKKIDQSILLKANTSSKKQATKKLSDLQRHQKQFLQQYYRQKRLEQNIEIKQIKVHKQQKQQKIQKVEEVRKEEQKQKPMPKQEQKKQQKQQDEWAEYDPNVGALITKGYIQKIQNGEDGDFDDEFSYQSQKSKKSSSSEDQEDDMFADEGPRTVVKTKQDRSQIQKKEIPNKEVVTISSHLFTQIAEQVGLHPETCTWIISNKQQKYKVTTLYMNQYYKNSGLSGAFPYVSLNNSQFVHNEELNTEKAISKFKHQGQRRRKNPNNFTKNNTNQRPPNTHYKQKK